jgi:cytochrome b6-f complex iron-sulfur subunit/menaquinol-cytochrome c reductase iron-sulfur subunit
MESGGRRRALKVVLGAGALTLGAATAAPLGAVLESPPGARAGRQRWIRTLRLDDLEEGKPRRFAIVSDVHDAWSAQKNITLGAVWLVRDPGDAVRCFSVTCPHLGCSVTSTEHGFYCPCHDSDFGSLGERKSGPSPRNLDALETRIVDGWVEVDFRRYRVGLKERVEIG